MPKFNTKGKTIINSKRSSFDKKTNFSIIFLGDSHIGQTTMNSPNKGQPCNCGTTTTNCPQKRYSSLLTKLVAKISSNNTFKNVFCIIHGGDARHFGRSNLVKFINKTESILKYDNKNIKNKDKTPLILNIGNHDYNYTKPVTMKDYKELVGKDNDIIQLHGQKKGPQIAIIMLNTGYNINGKFPKDTDFKKELDQISKKMKDIIKAQPKVRFIVDMHIPPKIKGYLSGDHTLRLKYTDQFLSFLRNHSTRVIAVVTHHKHAFYQSGIIPYNFNKNGKPHTIPIYLTAQGGNCDYSKSPNEPNRYGFYKMNFAGKKGQVYKIDSVYRYDMVKQNGKYKLNNGQKIQ